jgi:hypothetical protein
MPARHSKRKKVARKSPPSNSLESGFKPTVQLLSGRVQASVTALVNNRALGDAHCPPLPAVRPPSPVRPFIPIRHTDMARLIADDPQPVAKPKPARRTPQSVPMKVTRSASAKSPPASQGDPLKKKRQLPELALPAAAARMKRAASTQAMEQIQAAQSGTSDAEEPAQPNKKRRTAVKRAASLGPTSPLAKGFGADALSIPGATTKAAARSRSRLASPLSAGGQSTEEGEEDSVSPTESKNGYSTRTKSGRVREGPGHLRCACTRRPQHETDRFRSDYDF